MPRPTLWAYLAYLITLVLSQEMLTLCWTNVGLVAQCGVSRWSTTQTLNPAIGKFALQVAFITIYVYNYIDCEANAVSNKID